MSCTRQQEDGHDSTRGMRTTVPKDGCAAHPPCSSTPVPSNSNAPHRRVRSMAETLEDRNLPRNQPTLTFRVTGASSVARLEPLLLDQGGRNQRPTIWLRSLDSGDDGARIDFVWETTVTKQQQQRHRDARVLNRLSGAQVCVRRCTAVDLGLISTYGDCNLDTIICPAKTAVIVLSSLHISRCQYHESLDESFM